MKYQESSVTGESFVRARQIVIEHPHGGTPSVTFVEQRVTVLGDEVIETPLGRIVFSFDENGTIPLRNPETNELTGQSVSHPEAYALLYSAYIQAALGRDAQQQDSEPDNDGIE